MSRPTHNSDPTLITPITEAELVTRVKTAQDSDAITTLVNLHTGIYFTIAHNYATAYPGIIRANDLADDKMYNIYRFVLDYKPDRNMKLGTYIGMRTDLLCKTMLKKDKRNPLSAGTCAASGAMTLDDRDGSFSTTDGSSHVVLSDETANSHVEENANLDIGLEDILRVADSPKVCRDKRFVQILRYRHLNALYNHKTSLSWREIGKRMNLSYERVRTIYKENLAKVKAKLMEDNST